jgi:molybdopterin/thiamine biosynthesis adenylyltransferase
MPSDRFTPQAEFVPQEPLARCAVTVIGVGAIGRPVALQLAALGVRRLQLIDFDTVDRTNLTTQGYAARDLGLPKVETLQRALAALDPTIAVDVVCDRYRPQQSVGDVVFAGVDAIATRAALWRSVQPRTRF